MKSLAILLFLSISILTACTGTDDTTRLTPLSPTKNSTSLSLRDTSYEHSLEKTSDHIKNSPEFAHCMDQNVNMCIQTTGNQLAQRAKNPDICKELPDQNQQDGCIYAVTLIQATESRDSKICTTLNGASRTQCEMIVAKTIALAAKDIKLCDVLIVSKGTGTTLSHGPSPYDQCVLSITMTDTGSTAATCQKIIDPSLRDMCSSTLRQRGTIVPSKK